MIKLKHKKINNSGLSLVEVIISITILGVVAVPVLHSLTTAMVYNAKARARQEMTLTAESIMENFKGYDLEELQDDFGSTVIAGGQITCDSYDVPTGIDLGNPADLPAVGSSVDYKINGLTAENGKKYDVVITATSNGKKNVLKMRNMNKDRDAICYTGKMIASGTHTGSDIRYDDDMADKIYNDFVSAAQDTLRADILTKINEHSANPVVDVDGNEITDDILKSNNIRSYMEIYDRHLKYVIQESGDDYVVTAQMVYRYRIKDFPYYEPVIPTPAPDPYLDPSETPSSVAGEVTSAGELKYLDYFPISDANYPEIAIDMSGMGTDTGSSNIYEIYRAPKTAGLSRLFIYYYPNYELNSQHDIIEINNQAGINDFECYIIKERAVDMSETSTGVRENGYSAKVVGINSATNFNLYHNFAVNIGNGSSTTAPAISGFSNSGASYTLSDYTTSDHLYEDEVLSYSLDLKVMDAGTTNVVTELQSSMMGTIK